MYRCMYGNMLCIHVFFMHIYKNEALEVTFQ